MPDLYPPSTERDDRRLQAVMEELVHDVARTDPDSRHFQLLNPGRLELTRTLAIVRRLDTRPWAADVRQSASVEPAANGDEVSTSDFLYGIPDTIELLEQERWGTGKETFRDHEGVKPALSDLTAVFLDDEMILQSGRALYRMDGPSDVESTEADIDGQIISSGPGGYGRAIGNNTTEGEVAVQVDGLDIRFAGRGYFDIDVRFTGVATVQDGDDLSNLTGYVGALKLYDSEQNETGYTLSGSTINISEGGEFTLYYEGEWTKDYEAKGSTRLHELPEQSVSLVPIAEDLYDVPDEEQITCMQTREVVARLILENGEVDVTADGYVGTTNVGHDIHHALPGSHHVLALGDGRLTVVEPEAGGTRAKFTVPTATIGVRPWRQEQKQALQREYPPRRNF